MFDVIDRTHPGVLGDPPHPMCGTPLGIGIERPSTVLLNVGTGAQALTVIDRPDPSYAASASAPAAS